jgi:hypothetical protein
VEIGVRNVIFLYAILAIGLEITVWVVPSMIENAVAVSKLFYRMIQRGD